jgi:hypothetical protein
MMQPANAGANNGPGRAPRVNAQDLLTKYIAKLLMMRGARGVTCKVFRPSGGGGPYPAMLEKGTVSEQFFLNARDVDLFARTGTEINLSGDVRTALRNLDKRYQKKMAGRG